MISEVYNIDCLEFMRTMPDGFYDLAIADPPYAGANDPTINGGGGSASGLTGTKNTRQLIGT